MIAFTSRIPARRRSIADVLLNPAAALTLLVVASVGARAALVFGREIPRYMPDEYLYGQLARSIAAGHGFEVLGEPALIPAVLQPLITAPAWLAGDPELAFRLTQVVNAIAMSLAAVVVYAIARRLALPPGLALGSAALAIASPDLLYAGYVTADAIGYLLALLAILAGLHALEHGRVVPQLLFLAAAGAATLARLQYAAIVIAVAAAAFVSERLSVRAAIRHHLLLVGAPLLAGVALLASGGLGRYGAMTSFSASSATIAWFPASAFLLALASGAVIVPGALAWTLCHVVRPTSRIRSAYATLTLTLTVILIGGAALFAGQTGSDRFFERYLMTLIPLVAVAFCCWAMEERPGRAIALGAAGALILAVASLPLSTYTAGQGRADSPLLLAAGRLEQEIGIGNASLLIALAGTACLACSIATALGRLGAGAALGVTIALLGLVSIGAHAADRDLSHAVRVEKLGAVADWVDRAGAKDVLLVETADSDPSDAMAVISRNVSITSAALLGPATLPFDGAVRRLGTDDDGLLRLEGAPIERPLLMSVAATRVLAADGRVMAAGPGFHLIAPNGPARLAVVASGLYEDGWLAGSGTITIFGTGAPATCRHTSVELTLPAGSPPTTLTVRGVGLPRTLTIRGGETTRLPLETAARSYTLTFAATTPRLLTDHDLRTVSVRARLRTTLAACRASR